MATKTQMLEALHRADKGSLNKRYSDAELKAAYSKIPQGAQRGGGGNKNVAHTMVNPDGTVNKKASSTNPNAVFNQTVESNRQQAVGSNRLANANETGPFGSRSITYDENGTPIVNTQLSQGQQGVVSGLEGTSTGASSLANSLLTGFRGAQSSGPQALGQPSDPYYANGKLTGGPSFVNDGGIKSSGNPITDYQNAVYTQYTQGLSQRQEQDRQALEQNLANRGIPVGSDAYNQSMSGFRKDYGDQYTNAQSQAIQGGSNMFNQTLGTLGQSAASGYMNGPGLTTQIGFQGGNNVDYGNSAATTRGVNLANKAQANAGRGSGARPGGSGDSQSPIIGGNAPGFGI